MPHEQEEAIAKAMRAEIAFWEKAAQDAHEFWPARTVLERMRTLALQVNLAHTESFVEKHNVRRPPDAT